MSYDHVKGFLETTAEINHWLTHSKIAKIHKFLCTRKAKHLILYSGTILGAIMMIHSAYQVPQILTAHEFNDTAARVYAHGLFPLMLFMLVPFFNILVLNPAWSKKSKLNINGYLNLTQKASIKFKNKVVSNFLKNNDSQWDELAPLLLEAVNNEDLPLAWWEALDIHMGKTPSPTESTVVTVEKKSMDDLENDLKLKASAMNANQNHLSV